MGIYLVLLRLAVSYGVHIVIPPAFGAIGSAFGLAPIFWACAALLGGGALLNRENSKARGAKPR